VALAPAAAAGLHASNLQQLGELEKAGIKVELQAPFVAYEYIPGEFGTLAFQLHLQTTIFQ
jgi:hypothetical protein